MQKLRFIPQSVLRAVKQQVKHIVPYRNFFTTRLNEIQVDANLSFPSVEYEFPTQLLTPDIHLTPNKFARMPRQDGEYILLRQPSRVMQWQKQNTSSQENALSKNSYNKKLIPLKTKKVNTPITNTIKENPTQQESIEIKDPGMEDFLQVQRSCIESIHDGRGTIEGTSITPIHIVKESSKVNDLIDTRETSDILQDPYNTNVSVDLTSVLRKRKTKMNRHQMAKRRKAQRFLSQKKKLRV